MSINIYKQLEKIVLPSLINFKEDLTKYDKETISNNKGTKFLYAFRPNGTNILMLDKKRFINSSKEGVEKALRDSFDILISGKAPFKDMQEFFTKFISVVRKNKLP